MKTVPYTSCVGSLIYAQVCTHPDLAFVTGMLGRYQKNSDKSHWDGVKKALRYLQGTKGLMLTYKKSDAPLEIVGYSDSDFAGCLDTEKSTLGYIFTLTNGAISWKRSKQTITTSSMMYAEFIACYEANRQTKWLKKFVPGLRVIDNIEKSLKIYCNNEPTVQYSYNNKKSDASKHINIKYYVVNEKIQDQTISLEHISTKQMLVNLFTKSLPPNVFNEHIADMGLRESI
jgi:hypothetical protein